jgi:phage terminase small subunit
VVPVDPKYVKPSLKASAVQARHDAFARAFKLNGGNAKQAAIAAGYKPTNAHTIGFQLAERLKLREAARTHEQRILEKNALTQERVLEELKRIVFADPRKFYDKNGRLKPIHELDDATASALASIDVDSLYAGRGPKKKLAGTTTKIRMHDKLAAIDKAMRYLGLFEKDNASKAPSLAIQINAVAVPPRSPGTHSTHIKVTGRRADDDGP